MAHTCEVTGDAAADAALGVVSFFLRSVTFTRVVHGAFNE